MRHRPIVLLALTVALACASLASAFSQNPSPDMPPVMVTVDASHPWVDSGLTVQKGDRIVFESDGSIQWGSQPGQVAGPEGHGAKPGKVGAGGLIGRVGFTGRPFPIGATRIPIVMAKSGKLFLGINDFVFRDNAGAFHVRVRRSPT